MEASYKEFLQRLETLIRKNPKLIKITLSNIFTTRLIGNKTHGDLAEVAISEFINQYMYDYRSEHIGKRKFRSKEFEEDIKVISEISNLEFFISIKAYGHGPLQLSTDKNYKMFPALERLLGETEVFRDRDKIKDILKSEDFSGLDRLNVLPLIYDEREKRCNIMIFDFDRFLESVAEIRLEKEGEKNRKYPVFKFYDGEGRYICEVRYGGKSANALQRGFWTHTENAERYFYSLTGGWISYFDNDDLVKLIQYALISSQDAHKKAIEILGEDIQNLKKIV